MTRGALLAVRRRFLITIAAVLVQFLGLVPAIAVTAASSAASATLAPGGSSFSPVGPARVMDTRNGTGGTTGPVVAGSTVVLPVAGGHGVPSSGVTAVVFALTAVSPGGSGWVSVFADGTAGPGATVLNYASGQNITSTVTVPLGSDGKVDLTANGASTQMVADLVGYYAASGSSFSPVGPARVMDTRNGTGGTTGPVVAGSTVVLPVAGGHGVPSSGVTAVVFALTAVSPGGSGWVSVFADGTAGPGATVLNYASGQNITSTVTVPLGSDGKVDLTANGASTQMVADLVGYYYGAPDAPAGVSAVPGNGQAIVSWTAPGSAGASAVTGYTVTASPGGATASTTGQVTGVTVTGLANGTAYAFTVTAANTQGTSAPSAPSAAVTPAAGGTLYAHDADGRVTGVFDGSGAGSRIGYDPDGNITAVTPLPASAVAVAQVSPQAAAPGASIRIYGTGFGASTAGVTVTAGGQAATVTSVTPNLITATIASGASGSGLSVTAGGATATGSFAVRTPLGSPAISSLSAQVANPGSTLTVTGTGFSGDPAQDVAAINGTKVSVTAATATSLTVTLPGLPVAGTVTVTTPGGSATSAAQVVTVPPPYLAANVAFAGGLANATATTINVPTANDIALALFTVAPGQRASVQVNATIPDAGGQANQYSMNVWGPQGQVADPNLAGVIRANPSTWSMPDGLPAGVYEVELIPVNGDTGSFQVTATAITDPAASMTTDGPAVPVSVATAGQHAVWALDGTAGQQVYLQYSGSGLISVHAATLFGPDGSPLAYDKGGLGYLTARLPGTGTYQLIVDPQSPTGTFTAQASSVPAAAAGSTSVDGTAASLTISKAGQDGVATFSGATGQRVFTQVTFGSTMVNDNVVITAPDGSVVGQSAFFSSTVTVDTVTLPAAGTYQVKLSHLVKIAGLQEVGFTGTATVTVTTASDVTASTTVDGTAASLAIARPGDHGIVSFTGTSGQKVFTALTMSPAASITGSVKLLQEPGGTVIGSNGFTGSSGYIDTVTLPAAGTYEVLADPVGGSAAYTGTITVAVTSAPDQAGTTAVDGTAASVTLAKPGERVIASFPGTAGQKVFAQVSLSGTVSQCGNAVLVDVAAGATVTFGGCLSSAPVYFDDTSLPDTSTYQVIITPAGGYTGTVTVTVTSVPAAATASGTYGGPAVSVTTAKPGQDALITFSGAPAGASAKVSVTASTFPSGGTPAGLLTDPAGIQLTQCTLTVGVTCTATLSAAGAYTVQVKHHGPGTGSITIQLASASGAAAAARAAGGPQPARRSPGAARTPSPPARSGPPRWSWSASAHALAPASLTGAIRTTGGAPLPGVTVSIAGRRARTDATGTFRLTRLPQGLQALEMDGRTASSPARAFGVFDAQLQLRPGPNKLPFTSYFPVLDTVHEVSVAEPLAENVTLTTPSIPGLAVHLDKGSYITDADGKPAYKLGITAIPVTRTPIPMPVGEQVPVYFTVQPAGGHITHGWATIDYPNYHHARPGTPFDFWHYDLHGSGWSIYGSGSVNPAGSQVTPGKDTWVTDFNGAMISTPGYPDPRQSWLAKFLSLSADPVDPGTGLFHLTQTDLVVPDVIPLTLTRGYNSGDGNARQFGSDSSDLYDTFLTHDQPEPSQYTEADLNLIDGARIHFTRISAGQDFTNAVMTTQSTSPAFYGATLAWDGHGWNLTLRDGMTLIYGENAPLQQIRDTHGNTVRIFRLFQDSFGQYNGPITSVVSPNGYWLAYTWNTAVNPPQLAKVTDNAGQAVSYGYDPSGNLSTVTDPDTHVTTYGYDFSGRLTSIRDASGTQYLANAYNSSGQVTSQAIAGVGSYGFSYGGSSSAPQTTVTEPDGTTRILTYDSAGYLSSDARASGTAVAHTITVTPDARFISGALPAAVTDGHGRSVTSTYDSSGDELAGTHTSGGTSISGSATYNGTPYGLPDTVTGPDGKTTKYSYDAGGDLTKVTDAMGQAATAVYDGQGEQSSITGPAGDVTTYAYSGGRPATVTAPLGRTTRYAYDQAGRLTVVTAPDGTATRTTYDADNQVTSTTDADGQTTTYAYDATGHLHQVTDPKGNVTTYDYNSAGQLQSVTDALGNSDASTYNPAGQLATYTDRDGKKNTYSYDQLGKLTTACYNQALSGSCESTLSYAYDPSTGNLHSVTDSTSGAGTVTYTYDALDHVTSETGPGGTITYAYNPAGQATSVTLPGQAAITYAYDANGRLTSEIQGSQTVTYTYGANGQLVSKAMPDHVTARYYYDAASELTEIDYWNGTSAFLGNVTYGYDSAGQRIAEGGTLVNTVLPAAKSGSTYNADNELTSFGGKAYSYDPDGHLTSDGTSTYTWNARGQLASVAAPSGTSTLGYDPTGNLISTTVGGVTTTFAYQQSQLISESVSGGASYAFLNDPSGALSSTNTGNGAVQAYLPDALNSTLALVNSAGTTQTSYSYDLLGNAASSAGASDPNPLRYTGLISGPAMPAGLQDNNARDYNPATGTFISQDPLGMSGSGNDLYAYASGDPVDYSDPSGLEEEQLAACGIGAIFNDIAGVINGDKHSLGDFFLGALGGCLQGVAFTIPGAEEAIAELEGVGAAADVAASEGAAGIEDLTTLGDDVAGDGTGYDGLGEDACTSAAANSFAGSTPVTLADGTTKPIDQLKPGDYVKATDPATGITTSQPVLAVIKGHKDEQFARLTITTGAGRALRSGTIIATAGHPFYDQTRHAWITAGNLRIGDHLQALDGTPVVVTAIQRYDKAGATAWNLTVANDHDYYVTAINGYTGNGADQEILVHNSGCNWNKLLGDAYRDHIASFLEQRGLTVVTDAENAAALTFDTPWGERTYDIGLIGSGGKITDYIEVKSGDAGKDALQVIKDDYLEKRFGIKITYVFDQLANMHF
jgi:RHS repeat-associated protein